MKFNGFSVFFKIAPAIKNGKPLTLWWITGPGPLLCSTLLVVYVVILDKHKKDQRFRRVKQEGHEEAPWIAIDRWCQVIARRVEAQFQRDWCLTYSLWNYIFRTSVNMSRTIFAYDTSRSKGKPQISGEDLEQAAISICKALKGKYKAPDGKVRPVNGDMTKVRYAIGLHPAALKMLSNIEHTTSKIPGTQEVRKKMRHITHSYRVAYGQPIFITMSPDEKHNTLMLRFARTRHCDPVHRGNDNSRRWGSRTCPSLEEDFDVTMKLDPDRLRDSLPAYDTRREILARSPLAASDGFRSLCEVTLEQLFGLRFCPFCPECNDHDVDGPCCQDLLGSSAAPEGGIFGRADAFIGSIESQKAGSLHVHGQLFIQCLHQHNSLQKVLDTIRQKSYLLVNDYLDYKSHVSDQTYADRSGWDESRRNETESNWPEYRNTSTLLSRKQFLTDVSLGGRTWLSLFQKRKQELQEMKQHHVHLPDPENPEVRKPLNSCRRRDKPNECKGGFPQDKQLVAEPVVVCPGLAKQFKMPAKGRRNRIGSMHGPQNDADLDGTHGSLLVGNGFNTDVQLPYRLPITTETHSALCNDTCYENDDDASIVLAAQVTQDAQVGYSCDYQNKRNPVAIHETKEYMKGHQTLRQELKEESIGYVGRRHAQRIISDYYAKGIIRGAVECVNLLTRGLKNDVTAAETIKSARVKSFTGGAFLSLVERAANIGDGDAARVYPEVDMRSKKMRKILIKDMDFLYGYRGTDGELCYLSPYEFTREWEIQLVSYPNTKDDIENPKHHVIMKQSGRDKLDNAPKGEEVDLIPGEDYEIKSRDQLKAVTGGPWVPFPKIDEAQTLQHTWIMRRNCRPVVPVFEGCPMPKQRAGNSERNARIMLAYFHPWTLEKNAEIPHVPHVAELLGGAGTWTEAFNAWLAGRILTQDAARTVTNFMCVSRLRPSDDHDETGGNSEDFMDDEELFLAPTDLAEALQTRIGGKQPDEEEHAVKDEDPDHYHNSKTAMALAQTIWHSEVNRTSGQRQSRMPCLPQDMQTVLSAAAKSKKMDPWTAMHSQETTLPSVRSLPQPTDRDAKKWLDKTRLEVNDEQYAILEKVVDRAMQEERDGDRGETSEPLLHLMHGFPGVGKSFVLMKIREFFEDVMHWKIGVEFNFAALQAVMAVAIRGETLHHVTGINPFRKGHTDEELRVSAEALAKRLLGMRWLIIDEISMISANFLAQVDVKLRDAIREAGTYKVGEGGRIRSFGGLNVLFAGDFCQLDPPDGIPIPSIPKELLSLRKEVPPLATAAHGQQIFWGRSPLSVQGVTELTEPYRCKDQWYNEFLQECREMRLSENNYNFIHGRETTVPGSWLRGEAQCGESRCKELPERWMKERRKPWETRQRQECGKCKKERQRRWRVALDDEDADFEKPKFVKAPAIVANNDVKYDTNKTRAIHYARAQKASILWCVAKDSVTLDALRDDPSLPTRKLDWLQRHDRECGDLYGMFPLVKGMPVALADHIDRNPEKNLLRGTVGHIHSWVLHEDDRADEYASDAILHKLPKVVFVKFPGAKWKLQGMKEAGVYPITPTKRSWALDRHRKVPRLKIVREQLPLAPAFAMTAHASQGQTLDAAIVDLMISKESSPQTSYVALSRVRKAEDILIFRPFAREIFTRRRALGPELLIRRLRREEIDRAELEERLGAASKTKKQKTNDGASPKRGCPPLSQ